MPDFDYSVLVQLDIPGENGSQTYKLPQVTSDESGQSIGVDYVNDIYTFTYPYLVDEGVGTESVAFDSTDKTEYPGYYWAWEGLGFEIQAIIPDFRSNPEIGTTIGVMVFDSTTQAGIDVLAADTGNEYNTIWTAYAWTNTLYYWSSGKDFNRSYFYIGSEDEYHFCWDEASMPEWWCDNHYYRWNTGNTSMDGYLGIFDFPFNTRYSFFRSAGGNTNPNAGSDLTGWYQDDSSIGGNTYTIMESYDKNSEDDLRKWTDEIDNSSFIVLLRMTGDDSGAGGRSARDRIYYKFIIPKHHYKKLIQDSSVDKLIIEYGSAWYYQDQNYVGYWKSSSDYPRSMGLDITSNNEVFEEYNGGNRLPMVAGKQDSNGGSQSVFTLSGIRFILSGPGGIDREMVTQDDPSYPNTYDPYSLTGESMGGLGGQPNSWSKNLGYVDGSPTDVEFIDDHYVDVEYSYGRFNPQHSVDYTSFDNADRPSITLPEFRPIGDVYIESQDGIPLSTQTLYDPGTVEFEQVSSPVLVKVGFKISKNTFLIDPVQSSELTNNVNGNHSEYNGYGYKFSILRWGDEPGDEELTEITVMNNIIEALNNQEFKAWQEVYGPNGEMGELSHIYIESGITTIIAAVFAYKEALVSRLDDTDRVLQPMRWKLVKMVLNLNDGIFLFEDFAEMGGRDFTTIPWVYGKDTIIGGLSKESKYATSVEATFNGGVFDAINDSKDAGKIANARKNDELGKWPGKLDIEQTRIFLGVYDMHELLNIDPEVDGWNPYTDVWHPIENPNGYWKGGSDIFGNPDDSAAFPLEGELEDQSCVGTQYITKSFMKQLKDDCILELNMGEIDRRKITDTGGNANAGLLIGDYSVKKLKAQPLTRDSFIDIPIAGSEDKAL